MNVDSKNKVYQIFVPILDENAPFWDQKSFLQNIQYCHLFNVMCYHCSRFQKKILYVNSKKKCTRLLAQSGVQVPPNLGPKIKTFFFTKTHYRHLCLLVAPYPHTKFHKNPWVDSERRV